MLSSFEDFNSCWIGGAKLPVPANWDRIRSWRDEQLKETDWTQLADAPLNTQQKEAWTTYRQQLRDLPQNNQDINNINWPVPPVI